MLELNKLGRSAIGQIKRNLRKSKATGKTLNSLKMKSSETTLQIFGRGGLLWAETGRPPAKSSSPKWEVSSLVQWMDAKGIGASLDDKKKENLAKFFKLRINRLGTRKWQEGQGDIVDNVYTNVLDDLTDEVERRLLDTDEMFNLNYKGKNVIIR